MKASVYNHFFDFSDTITLAYNSCSGVLAEITRENLPRIQQLLKSPEGALGEEDHQFVEYLRQGQFLVPEGLDQRAALQTKARSVRREGRALTLTVAPTLACNFDCDYCFESRSNAHMSEDTEAALLDFTDRQLRRADALRVCWFGGEPTLCFPIIERLQRGFLALAAKWHTTIIPGLIITNGYLLDETMARQLKDLSVTCVQITLDGPREVHDARRRLRNGRGSFERIIENVKAIADILNLSIRINIDRDNVDSAYQVVEQLHQCGLLAKVKVTFAQVRYGGGVCASVRDRCYDTEEFSTTLVRIYRRLLEGGLTQCEYPRVTKGAACGALAEGYYVVSPTGHLFTCWEELSLDESKSIGHVHTMEPTSQQAENLRAFREWDPFTMSECRDCDILPICMGGCPLAAMRNGETSHGTCAAWKYNLADMLKLAYSGAVE